MKKESCKLVQRCSKMKSCKRFFKLFCKEEELANGGPGSPDQLAARSSAALAAFSFENKADFLSQIREV